VHRELDDLVVEADPVLLKRQSVRGAAVSSLAQLARFVFQFGSQLYLAHMLSPSAFGLVAMVSPILRFVLLFNDMGLLQATIQRPTISHRQLSALFWINLSASVVLICALIAAAPLVGWLYREPRIPAITASLASVLLLSGLSAQPMALMNRRMRFIPLAIIDVASTVCGAVIGIGAAWLGWGYWALVAMQAGNSVTICLLAWALADWRPSRPRLEPGIAPLLGFGGNVTAYNVLGFFAASLDDVLLGSTNGSLALGLYERSSKLVIAPVIQIYVPFTRVSVPLLSRLQDAAEQYRRAYLQLLQISLMLITPGLLCAVVLADQIVLALLGPAWGAAGPITRWLAIGGLTQPIIASASWLFVSQNRARQQLLWGSIGFAMIVASFVVGLPWGPLGVARSSATCMWLLQAPLIVWAATRAGPVRGHDLVFASYPMLIGSAAAVVVLFLAKARFGLSGIEGLLFALFVSYGTHAAVLALIPAGQKMLRETWALRSAFVQATS
jgi:PST family polysaccharide transporter